MDDDLSSGNKLRIPTQLPEVVTPYTRTRHAVGERGLGGRRERRLEKSGGIHSYDRQWRLHCIHIVRIHTYTYALALYARGGGGQKGVWSWFINFWDSPDETPRSLETHADLSLDPSRTAAFAESLLSLFPLSPFLRYFFLPLLFSRYSLPFFSLRALRIAGNLINREFFVAAAAPRVGRATV